MSHKYTAKLYLGNDEIMCNSGDDLDELHTWLLSRAEGVLGNIHGEIIDEATKKIVKQFRKVPPE